MTTDDLTLGEVREAEQYGLNAHQYDELKTRLEQKTRVRLYEDVRKQYMKETEDLRKEIERDVRPKLREELKKELVEDLSTKFENEKRVQLRQEIEKEIATTAPSPKQREAARDMARELELEYLTGARAASDLVDQEEVTFKSDGAGRAVVFYVLLFAGLPLFAFLHIVEGWGFLPQMSLAIPYAVATILFGSINSIYKDRMSKKIQALREKVIEFRKLAGTAKEARMVRVDTANTKADLVSILQGLQRNEYYNKDNEAFLPTSALDKAKLRIREDILTDMDPEKLLRVESSEISTEPDAVIPVANAARL